MYLVYVRLDSMEAQKETEPPNHSSKPRQQTRVSNKPKIQSTRHPDKAKKNLFIDVDIDICVYRYTTHNIYTQYHVY